MRGALKDFYDYSELSCKKRGSYRKLFTYLKFETVHVGIPNLIIRLELPAVQQFPCCFTAAKYFQSDFPACKIVGKIKTTFIFRNLLGRIINFYLWHKNSWNFFTYRSIGEKNEVKKLNR